MPLSPFHQAVSESLRSQIASTIGATVIYRRGTSDATLVAAVAESRFEVADESGFMTTVRVRDYLIDAAELFLDGQLIEPRKGDIIEEQSATPGSSAVYDRFEVLRPGGGEPEWRWSDPGQTVRRVHTKRIGGTA